MKGGDLQIHLELTLKEISHETVKKIKVTRLIQCRECGGSGAAKGSERKTCPTCQGQGEIRQASRSLFGTFVNVSVCSTCGGEGTIVIDPCARCRGDGRVEGTSSVEVKIPAGVSTGNYITLAGQGDSAPRSGVPGDLIIVIEEIEVLGSGKLALAMRQGDLEMGSLMAGQCASMVTEIQPAAQIVADLVAGTEKALSTSCENVGS